MPATDYHRTEVRTYVDRDLRQRWERKFGKYATLSWLVSTAMEEVLNATEKDPSLDEVVRSCVRQHIKKHQYQPNPPRANVNSTPGVTK